MKKESKNTYKILLDSSTVSNLDLRLVKLRNIEILRRHNSEKFLNILADKIVFLSANNGWVDAKYNPHIAKDLIAEGNTLNHCIGRMNYDQKFVREESLIFFISIIENPNTPFVTVEYSLQNHKVLQCYGYNNSRPQADVLEFVNNKWLPYANRILRKIA